VTQPQPPAQADGLSQAATVAITASVAAVVLAELTGWLAEAKAAVLGGIAGVFNLTAFGALNASWDRRVDRILDDLMRAARRGWEETASQLGLDIAFDPTDPILIEQLNRTRNLLVRVDEEVYRMIVKAIADGTDLGESNEQIAARIDNILSITGSENWPNRADVIARTEVTRFTEAGALSAAQRWQVRTGRALEKQWVDRDDSRVRRGHADVDGDRQPLWGLFLVGMSLLRYPGDPVGLPHEVINCVPGDAIITARSVQAAFRYQWSGSVLTLRGKGGLVRTVSINHPVITEFGWLPAREVKKGMHLLCASFGDDTPGANPHPNGGPATAEEVFRTLTLTGVTHRVVPLVVDFHGDIPNGDVEVVLADWELTFGVQSTQAEQLDKFCLSCADLPGSPGGPLFQFGETSSDATNGGMGSTYLTGSLRLGHEGPLDALSVTATPNLNTSFNQSSSNSFPSDPQPVGQLLNGATVPVFLDEIIDVVEHDFSGHLYTFQTSSGIYIADNTVTHNCRCHLKFVEVRP
jgi:hypothetical protein